jgi:Flp pilus assembly protein CpaB
LTAEFEYTDPSRRGKVIVIVGVVLALVAGGAAFFLIASAQQQNGLAGVTTVPIVVAAREIPSRKILAADDLVVRQVPDDVSLSLGVYADPKRLIGLIAGTTILAGQPVFANMLAGQSAGAQFAILGPTETVSPDSPAWRAISILVPDDRAVGGLVEAGQTVDVFVTATVTVPDGIADEGRYFTDKSTKIVYQDILILAKTGTGYVIRAPIAMAEEITHFAATGGGTFSFALRPDIDQRTVDASKLGATTTMIVDRYGLPMSQWYPAGRGPATTPVPVVPAATTTPNPPLDPNATEPPQP